MFSTFRNAWKIPDLRRKLLYTFMIIIFFRIGSAIPVPFLNPTVLHQMMSSGGNSLLGYIDILTGGAFSRATIFSMSVTPYINSSIIIQLLGVAIPALERLTKEGEAGQKVLVQITRYVTIVLGLIQGIAYYFYLRNNKAVTYTSGFTGVWVAFVIVTVFIAGTALMMWFGERINDNGIGNGISILLFAGIVSRGPAIWNTMSQFWQLGGKYYALVPVMAVLGLVVVAAIVYMNDAERRIPVQYAKRVVGRKLYGGQNSYIPVKALMSGVMPIIFASSIMIIPSYIAAVLPKKTVWYTIFNFFNYENSWAYAVIYFLLILAFNSFYIAIQYNPFEISNNLRKNNGGIPGIRPGRPTSDYINHCIHRISFIGAIFLGLIAVLPIAITAGTKMNISLGGTSLLIVVGVAIETSRQLESMMMMRHYKGFLE